jgi:hypothetical protein
MIFASHARSPDARPLSNTHAATRCVSPQLAGSCWNEFNVDGALGNVGARVDGVLRDVVGARLVKPQDPASYSCRRKKDGRPFVESFFGRLAAGGFHRLATTAGSSPAGNAVPILTRLRSPCSFQPEYAQELLDTVIAIYNATPHSGLGYRNPLKQLERLTAGNEHGAHYAAVSTQQGVFLGAEVRNFREWTKTGEHDLFCPEATFPPVQRGEE